MSKFVVSDLKNRATPMKVEQFVNEHGQGYYRCPKCKNEEKLWQTNYVNFCLNCGQALYFEPKEETE